MSFKGTVSCKDEEMRLEGIQPPNVTFLSLLRACSHFGLFERGMDYGVVGIHGERLGAKSKIRTLCLCC